jgi:hypothetical protein
MSRLGFLVSDDAAEQRARTRELRAIVKLICGPGDPCTTIFNAAVDGIIDIEEALPALDLLPSLPRRRILAAAGSLWWPTNRRRRVP